MSMSHDAAKNAAGLRALDFVKDGMKIGLGTGSTTAFFIHHLIKKCKKGMKIQAVATSLTTEKMARKGKIPMLDVNEVTSLDLTVDGADEIDPQKRLIKGAGGALIREKIIAHMSQEMVVIADESKLVPKLGIQPLPVEVNPFGGMATKKQIEDLGFRTSWRKNKDGSQYVTDNQNWILDLVFEKPLDNPEALHAILIENPGVIETGFFFNYATRIVIGKEGGTVTIIN